MVVGSVPPKLLSPPGLGTIAMFWLLVSASAGCAGPAKVPIRERATTRMKAGTRRLIEFLPRVCGDSFLVALTAADGASESPHFVHDSVVRPLRAPEQTRATSTPIPPPQAKPLARPITDLDGARLA